MWGSTKACNYSTFPWILLRFYCWAGCVFITMIQAVVLLQDMHFIMIKAVRVDSRPVCPCGFQVAHTHKLQFVLMVSSLSLLFIILHLSSPQDCLLCVFKFHHKNTLNTALNTKTVPLEIPTIALDQILVTNICTYKWFCLSDWTLIKTLHKSNKRGLRISHLSYETLHRGIKDDLNK